MLRHLLLITFLSTSVGCLSQNNKLKREEDFKKFDITGNGSLTGTEITSCNCKSYDRDGDNVIYLEEYLQGSGFKAANNKLTKSTTPDKEPTGSMFSTGKQVEILYNGVWYPGSILEVKGDQYMIHYDKYSSNWDSWVTKDKLRAIGKDEASTNSTSGKITGNSGGRYYSGFSAGLGQTYHYFLTNGQVVYGCISGGLEYYDVAAACTKDPYYCGTYKQNGNSISVSWSNGEKYEGTVSGRNINNLNATNFSRVYPVPGKLSANYSTESAVSGAAGTQLFQFTENGRFIRDVVSGYDHGDGRWGAETASNRKGKYRIEGYTITMTYDNGIIQRHTIYALEPNKNPGSLGWDCGFMTRR